MTLVPFEYYHELTEPGELGETEHVAGWGIWSTDDHDALFYDGFSSEVQAQAGIDTLESNPLFDPDLDLPGRSSTPVDFLSLFGHDWECIPCPETCEMRVYDEARESGGPSDLIPENCDLCGTRGDSGDLNQRVDLSVPADAGLRAGWLCDGCNLQ